MIRRPPRSTQSRSSAASDVYKRQIYRRVAVFVWMILRSTHLCRSAHVCLRATCLCRATCSVGENVQWWGPTLGKGSFGVLMVSGGLIRRFSRPKSFCCGLSAPVRATAVISLLGFLAFLLLLTAFPSAPAYAATPIPGPAQAGYLQDMRDAALDEVNVRRDVAQVAPVEVHSALEEAAQQHALYLLLNSDQWGGGFSAHVEDSGLPGFYATGLGERVDLAGYPHTYVMEDVLRLTSDADYDGESPWPVEKVVGKWIDAPFHRRTARGLSPHLRDGGRVAAHLRCRLRRRIPLAGGEGRGQVDRRTLSPAHSSGGICGGGGLWLCYGRLPSRLRTGCGP